MSHIALETIALILEGVLAHNEAAFARSNTPVQDDYSVFVQVQRGTLKNWIKAIREAAGEGR